MNNSKLEHIIKESILNIINEAISIQDKYNIEKTNGKTKLPFEHYRTICEIDPTSENGMPGKYCNWLLAHANEIGGDDINQLHISLEQFNDGLKRGILKQHDINTNIGSYKTVDDFLQTMYKLMHSDDLGMSQSEYNNRQKLDGQYGILGSNELYEIITPKTFEAEHYFGSGTEWCTVANNSYFKQYMKQGQLYILYPKNGDNKLKMQFHFESKTFATYNDIVHKKPVSCITSLYENETTVETIVGLCRKVFPFYKFRYIRFSEVQWMLDSVEKPEEIFDKCWDFNDGYARVKLNNKWNFISTNGELVSPNQWFDWCGDFNDGYAAVKLNNKWNFISTNGELFATQEEAQVDSQSNNNQLTENRKIEKEETTFYRFYSEVRSFIGKLLKKPTSAEPTKYLLDREFTKERLIKLLRDEKILKRDEKILTPNKDKVKKVQYSVKYTLNSDAFEDKIEKIHKKYFGDKNNRLDKNKSFFKDEDKMKQDIMKNKQDAEAYRTRGGMKMDECDCSSCSGDIAGATNAESSGQFIQPLTGVQRREPLLATKQKKSEKHIDPTKILGKTINESKNMKKVRFSEEQMKYILDSNGVKDIDEATTCASVGAGTTRGDIGYDTPGFDTSKDPGFWKDSLKHGKK